MVKNYILTDITEVLVKGGLLLYPTDTIWGIGCDATNAAAIKEIYTLKKRDLSQKFIILVDSIEMLKDYVQEVPPKIDNLLLYHERPLTVIYENAKNLPDILISDDGSIAIRVVVDGFCKDMIHQFGKPIVSTSANVSGAPFPQTFGGISSEIIQGVDYVVKHKQNSKITSEPSVLIKLSKKGELIFLRE